MGHYREYAPGLGVLIMRGDKNPGNHIWERQRRVTVLLSKQR